MQLYVCFIQSHVWNLGGIKQTKSPKQIRQSIVSSVKCQYHVILSININQKRHVRATDDYRIDTSMMAAYFKPSSMCCQSHAPKKTVPLKNAVYETEAPVNISLRGNRRIHPQCPLSRLLDVICRYRWISFYCTHRNNSRPWSARDLARSHQRRWLLVKWTNLLLLDVRLAVGWRILSLRSAEQTPPRSSHPQHRPSRPRRLHEQTVSLPPWTRIRHGSSAAGSFHLS